MKIFTPKTMFSLRPYQQEAVEALRQSFRGGKKAPLLVAPTGAGKTVIFSYVTQNAASKGNRVLLLVHRAELLAQTHAALDGMGVPHGIIAAGRTPDPAHLVQLASVQTVVRRLEKLLPVDLIVIDEAHHAAAGSWKKVIELFPNAKIIGVTATPQRLDGKGLGDIFDDIVFGPDVQTLIDSDFLCRPVYYAPSQVDLTSVKTRMGDFDQRQLEQALNTPVITGCAVSHYKKLSDGLPAVVFCASVRHATDVAAQFCSAGYRFEVLDGTLAPEIRKQRVADLASGKIHGLTSCDIISEGFDLPVVTTAILLRATQSLGLHLQQVGRVLRTHKDKSRAIILDHVGNCMRHGLAEEPREWSLEGASKKSKKASGGERNKQCPQCYCVHAVLPECPQCGHVYAPKPREIEHVDGELVELQARREHKKEQGKAQTLQDLIDLAKLRGYRNPYAWAGHVLRGRQK